MKRSFKTGSRSGHSIVEVTLMAPWLFFLFVGVLDFGFYSYAIVCTQNAARVAALQNAYSDSAAASMTGACDIVLQEMNSLPNTRTLNTCNFGTCPSTVGSVTDAQPIAVMACAVNGPDGALSAKVSVTYLTLPMIPIPGVMSRQMTITRTAQLRVLDIAP